MPSVFCRILEKQLKGINLTYGGVDEVSSPGGTAAELAVSSVDTSVNDEDIDTTSGKGIIDVGD